MSQQQHSPPQGTGQQTGGQMTQQTGQMGQQGMGGQMGQQGQMMHEGRQQLVPQMGEELDEDLTSELRVALHDYEEVSRTTRWCVDKMIDEGPQMAECIRCCQDLADIADLNVNMITRDSIYGLEAAMLFAAIGDDCLRIIEQHQMPHCQETADTVRRALDSTWQLIETFGEPQLMQQLYQQFQQSRQQTMQQQEMPPAVEQAQGSQGQMAGQGQQMGGGMGGQQMSGGRQMSGGQMGQQGMGGQMGQQGMGGQQPTGQGGSQQF